MDPNFKPAIIEKIDIPIKGMHCASCAYTIEKTLLKAPGVKSCKVNFATETAQIELDSTITDISKLNSKIRHLGYTLETSSTLTHNGLSENTGVDVSGATAPRHIHNHYSVYETESTSAKKAKYAFPLALFMFIFMLFEIINTSLGMPINTAGFSDYLKPMFFLMSTFVLFILGDQFIKGITIFARYKSANMDTLVGIGTMTAYLYSSFILLFPVLRMNLGLPDNTYFDVVIIVIGFVLYGNYLESHSKMKTRDAIKKLINLSAKTALVIRNGIEMEIPIEQIVIGDLIKIKPGAKVPTDGVITDGFSSIDESMITGESIPVDKQVGDFVIGATINKHGVLVIKATKVGKDTMLAQIIKYVEDAQNSKAPIQNLADRISSIFVPTVLIISVLSLGIWLIVGSLFLGFSNALPLGILCFVGVLVIACPCALGLATPTAIVVGMGKGAENGILIRNAESLERLLNINVVVLDKTGTVTEGNPVVTDFINLSADLSFMERNNLGQPKAEQPEVEQHRSRSDHEIYSVLYSLEKLSEHPISQAVVSKAKEYNVDNYNVNNFQAIQGKGIKGDISTKTYHIGNQKLMEEIGVELPKEHLDYLSDKGRSILLVAEESKIIAILGVADTIKSNVRETVDRLHQLKIKVVLLTGDNQKSANNITKELGIDEVFAEVLPHEKAEKVKKLQAEGYIVAMVGDGINDAPALVQSDVGIAMSTGTDIAIESAQATLLKGDVTKVLKALNLSRATYKIIKQNLFWAFIYNIVGIPFAAGLFYPLFGVLLNPIFAGMAMALSSVSVVTNSLRLRAIRI